MAKLYEEICRTLATPMSRSRALKLIFGGLAGAVLAPFGFGQQQACDPGTEFCQGVFPNGGGVQNCCPPGQHCCPVGVKGATSAHCCPGQVDGEPQVCCGDVCCQPNHTCDEHNVCQPPSNSRP